MPHTVEESYELADAAQMDHEFTASRGFEWSSPGLGHINVWFSDGWTDPVGTPRADLLVVRSDFTSNRATRTGSSPAACRGGAVDVEDQATARIHSSRFIGNLADDGGGLSVYRSIVEVADTGAGIPAHLSHRRSFEKVDDR